jgi:hypothetical protein
LSLVIVILVVALVAVVVVVVSAPLRSARRRQGGGRSVAGAPASDGQAGPADAGYGESAASSESTAVPEGLEAAREAKYREIRDAELDYRTGKLSREDYEAIDRQLRAEAIEILNRLDPERRGG